MRNFPKNLSDLGPTTRRRFRVRDSLSDTRKDTMEIRDPRRRKTVRVLIADDCDEDRALFRHILKTFDAFEVVWTTVDGADTIAYLKGESPYENQRIYRVPDLVLLDFQMPRYSGLEVLRELRSEPASRKIVLWSDAPELINQSSAYHLGASFVCAKPQVRSDLVKILTRALTAPGPCFSTQATQHGSRGHHVTNGAGPLKSL
jgi:CheY-like chemotaxis protein